MTRLLAIDFGERRIGLALSADGELVLPLQTLHRRTDREAVAQIVEAGRTEAVDGFVVGEPVLVDGSRGEAAQRTRSFAARLERASGLPVTLHPETLTTVAARERLRSTGVDLRRHPGRLDEVAAQILLEDYLRAQAPSRTPTAGEPLG
jgi:putative Holliday junction resolvase